VFRGNQPPKRHRVRIRAATGQRTLTVRYARFSDVRISDVDRDAGTVHGMAGEQTGAQVGEHAFPPSVLAGAEITISADGLPGRSRGRFLRAAERATGGDAVEVVLDGSSGRLG
jgi:hypothetical protein